ncbi:inositol 1,4,5-trisphosphate receptor-interacting protein-like 1 [Alca torda]
MAAIVHLVLLLLSIVQQPQRVGDGLGEATRERVRQREEYLRWKVTWLLWDIEQKSEGQKRQEQRSQAQGGFACGDLLLAALQQWQLWAFAALLVLLAGPCWWCRKRSRQPDNDEEEESSGSDEEESSGSDEEERGYFPEQEEEGEESDEEARLIRNFTNRVERAVWSEANRSQEVEELVGDLVGVLQEDLSDSFFPLPQPAIGVGSSFEGWSPRGHDAVYHLLVPLKPPRGHILKVDRAPTGPRLATDACVLVELECTCRRDQGVENMLCFLHHPEEELRRNQGPSLLDTLCTGSYLNVQQTAQWFQDLVSSVWRKIPQSHHYSMEVLPSSRSCKLQLTNASGRSLVIEMVLGVQQGDSDIFLSSQAPEATFTPSLMWPESFAVAEVKFFRHIARQAPHDTCHLKCLQLCAGILLGTGASTDSLKTVVMHLLNTMPVSSWRRRELPMRLRDIMEYLDDCPEEERLEHFFFGNENMPDEIVLPPAFQTAEPFNLFQRSEEEPDAYAEAVGKYRELQDRLTGLLYF